MATAVADAHAFNFSLLTAISMEDLDGNHANPRGYIPGGIFFLNSPFGPRLMQYVQNRTTTAYLQGQLISSVGDTDGKTQITSSGAAGVNTVTQATTSGLTADAHVGANMYILNSLISAGAPPEGEESVVVSNTATLVKVDPNLPFSATVTSGDTINLNGFYNAELSAIGDLGSVVLGVAVGKNGVDATNYGWVCKQGKCPNALIKASTAMTQNDAFIADTARLGPAVGGTATAQLQVGYAPNVVNSDIVSDKTTAFLTLGFGFNPGTTDVSA